MRGLSAILFLAVLPAALRGEPAKISAEYVLAGDWKITAKAKVPDGSNVSESFSIEPPPAISVTDEICEKLPTFNPKAWGGWQKGYALKELRAQECTVKGALDPTSLTVRTPGKTDGTTYVRGVDYETDLAWGSVGRLASGSIGENTPVALGYQYRPQRIDTIVLSNEKPARLLVKCGSPDVCQPRAPKLAEGEKPLINLLVVGDRPKLTTAEIFPIQETAFPEDLASPSKGVAEALLPQTMKKLRSGTPLKILAWGDSVTEGRYVAEQDRWQNQFLRRLRDRYPQAKIELATNGWSGHSTSDYLSAPAGSAKNYEEKILGSGADLVIMEFINDGGLKTDVVKERYGKLLKDFQGAGMEWIICTPHYMRPDWMGLPSQNHIDQDPREYVKALRTFTSENHIPLADVSLRFGRLWRQGLPYLTLMKNGINHPDERGLAIYADALMNLFP